jgi:hypothetical protein
VSQVVVEFLLLGSGVNNLVAQDFVANYLVAVDLVALDGFVAFAKVAAIGMN